MGTALAVNSILVDSRQSSDRRPESILGGGMSLVRLLGFTTLGCGCVIGRYREVATSREVTYVEEKGKSCGSHLHRRNHTVSVERLAVSAPIALVSQAS